MKPHTLWDRAEVKEMEEPDERGLVETMWERFRKRMRREAELRKKREKTLLAVFELGKENQVKENPDLEIYQRVLTVKVREDAFSGTEESIHDLSRLDRGVEHKVMGVYLKRWADSGETTPCYMLIDNNGVLTPFTLRNFVVVEVEERSQG